MLGLTEFQKKMLEAIPEDGISSWKLAEKISERWKNPPSRGGIISALTRASWKLIDLKLITRLPAKDQWGEAQYFRRIHK